MLYGTESVSGVDDPIRVLVVDDHPTVRAVVSGILQAHERLAVIDQAGDGVEAIARLSEQQAVMDVRMPRLNGIQSTSAIRALWPGVPILALSVLRSDDLAARAVMDAGAAAVVSKAEGSERIVAQILALTAGAESMA